MASGVSSVASGDSLDWKEIQAPEIQQRVLERVQPGSIILFHNAAKHTPEALPGIIESLQSQGYELVPVSQILCQGEYEIDHTGRQIPTTAQTSTQKDSP